MQNDPMEPMIEKYRQELLAFSRKYPKYTPQPDPDPEPAPEPPAPENYELLAFEWVESHILELNARCNEAVGSRKTTVLLKAEELPQKESWPAICAELDKQDIHNTACREEGIWIQLDGGAAA